MVRTLTFTTTDMDLIPGQGTKGFPVGYSGKESTCQCRRHERLRFDLWVGKIPYSRKWQTTPVFLPGESHGQRSLAGHTPRGGKELDTAEQQAWQGRELRFHKPGKKESCFSSVVPAAYISLVSFLLPKASGFYSQSPDLLSLPSLQLFSRSWKMTFPLQPTQT